MSAIVAAALVALTSTQKPQEFWRLRITLHGKEVEVYDLMKGDQKVGTGLREIVEKANYYNPPRHKKYADILKPEWADIRIAHSKTILAHKENKVNRPVWLIPSKLDGKRIKVEKPVQTPYVDIEGGTSFFMGGNDVVGSLNLANATSYLFGIRSKVSTDFYPSIEALAKLNIGYQSGMRYTLDVMDTDFNVKFTVNNARTLPYRFGSSWKVDYDTNDLAPLTQFLNDEGDPVSPAIPLIREFNLVRFGRIAYAIPTSLEFKRYIPILPDGRIRQETIPTAGYIPDYAIRNTKGGLWATWLKEYITTDGPRFGWANADLTKETGPIWRSIVWWPHRIVPSVPGENVLAQLADGTWMFYEVDYFSTSDFPYKPFLSQTYATREEAISAFEPIFKREIAEPILAQRRREAEVAAIKYAEMAKFVEIDPTMNAGGLSEVQLVSLLYRTITAYNARLYNDFDVAYKELAGDYYLKYLAIAYHLRRVGIDESSAKKYAALAVNPNVKATWESIAGYIKQEAQAKAQRDADAKRAREAGWSDPNKFAPRPPSGTSSWTSPWSNPYAPPSFAESSRRHEQYMNEMWKYLGGQQAWRPW